MLRRTTLLTLLPLTLGTLGLLAFTLPPAQGQRDPQGGARPEKSGLERTMEEINAAVRTISRGRDAGASDEVLAALATVQTRIVGAKSEVPSTLAQEDDATRKAAELTAFRRGMNDLLRGFLDLEDALLAGDSAAVDQALETLAELKDAGHERFKPRRSGR